MSIVSGLMGNAAKAEMAEVHAEFGRLLGAGEEMQHAYRLARDVFIFTNRRLLLIDRQGISGEKVEYLSIPYASIVRFSVETAGTFDLDAELKISTSGEGGFVQKTFSKAVDIYEVQALLAEYVCGGEVVAAATAAAGVDQASAAPAAEAEPAAEVAPTAEPVIEPATVAAATARAADEAATEISAPAAEAAAPAATSAAEEVASVVTPAAEEVAEAVAPAIAPAAEAVTPAAEAAAEAVSSAATADASQAAPAANQAAAQAVAPVTRPPAAWYPDPTGRHENRWWDGAQWTAYVADAGQQSQDRV